MMAKDQGYQEAERRIDKARRTGATVLDLEKLRLTAIPPSLRHLRNLTELLLNINLLGSLPDWVGELTNLTQLHLFGNKLTLLPDSLGNLVNLKLLDLGNNQLTFLPEWINKLSDLMFLYAPNNQLISLPEWLGDLTNLRRLDFSANKLSLIPESLGNLTELTRLDLFYNRLSLLPESFKRLKQLEILFLQGNNALGIPSEVLGFDLLKPELYRRDSTKKPADPKAILDYYFRLRKGHRPLNEVKLILVGRGGAGKTCLIKRLFGNTFDENEPETPGIEIGSHPVKLPDGDQVRLHVWDFGGQELLHATHQFFLTERTVYLLVVTGREGSAMPDAEYWLQLIDSFGGDSPVIVALNKSQKHPFDFNRGLLLEKYPRIVEFIKTDCGSTKEGEPCADGEAAMGLGELDQLIKQTVCRLEHRKKGFPEEWFAIKEALASTKKNYLTWEEYQALCRQFGESDAQAQRELSGYMHTLGIALNYRNDLRLKDKHVLNPHWVTEGIYTLLRAGQREREERHGVLGIEDLGRFLNAETYPKDCHDFLLGLMEQRKLCFPLPHDQGKYLVPELLGENQPDPIREMIAKPGLSFRLQYEIWTEGLLPRFIVMTHHLSAGKPDLRWRTGVVLERNGSQAVVRGDMQEERVDIYLAGPKRARLELLGIIREHFETMHAEMKGVVVNERVPLPDENGITVSYRYLCELENDGITGEYRFEGARKPHFVAMLLGGIEDRAQRLEKSQHITIIGGDYIGEGGRKMGFDQRGQRVGRQVNVDGGMYGDINFTEAEQSGELGMMLERIVEALNLAAGQGDIDKKTAVQARQSAERAALEIEEEKPDKGKVLGSLETAKKVLENVKGGGEAAIKIAGWVAKVAALAGAMWS